MGKNKFAELHSKHVQFWKAINCHTKYIMSLQLASTMRTDFLVWECHCCRLERRCTVCCGGSCFLTRYNRHFTGRECSNMVRGAKWRNQQTLQSTWWLNNQQFAAIYHFHSAPVPPTWLHKKRASRSISTRMGSCSEWHSRYITSSHPSRFFRKAYLCCQGRNSRCTLGATLG